MSFISLDFETFFQTSTRGHAPTSYSLKSMTYEQYLRGEFFKVFGVGIKIDNGKTEWVNKHLKEYLRELFYPGNTHTVLAHNIKFDGAILNWFYGVTAAKYYCTQAISQALWAQSSSSLDALTKRLFPNNPEKWKGNELMSVDGIWDLNEEQDETLGGYCIQDVDIMFDSFAAMYPYFPDDELEIIDMTEKMFIEPSFYLDRQAVEQHQTNLNTEERRLIKASGIAKSTLSSNPKFAGYLETEHGIIVPEKHSPTAKNPDNMTLALAKDDLEFIKIRNDHPELQHIWDARIAVKSTTEKTRCARLLDHSEPSHINPDGWIAAPLKYAGAHTKRWSGQNKVNFQNFKRGSPIRYALYGPEGYKVIVRDLSNIEGRMNAWFCEQEDKLQQFADGLDIYNILASDIYGRPVDRKKEIEVDGEIVCPDYEEGFVGKTAELGLGYQTGVDKLHATLAQKGVVKPRTFAANVVNTWRRKNYKIVAGWKKAERVIFDMASKDLVPYQWKCITVEKNRLRLPNGLYLTYPELTRVTDEATGHSNWEYWNGKFMTNIYGGSLIENIIQAISRCVLSDMMLRINSRIKEYSAKIVLTVHDEIIAIAPAQYAERVYEIMGEEMAIPPSWCNDGTLVLASEGGIDDNYSK